MAHIVSASGAYWPILLSHITPVLLFICIMRHTTRVCVTVHERLCIYCTVDWITSSSFVASYKHIPAVLLRKTATHNDVDQHTVGSWVAGRGGLYVRRTLTILNRYLFRALSGVVARGHFSASISEDRRAHLYGHHLRRTLGQVHILRPQGKRRAPWPNDWQ